MDLGPILVQSLLNQILTLNFDIISILSITPMNLSCIDKIISDVFIEN